MLDIKSPKEVADMKRKELEEGKEDAPQHPLDPLASHVHTVFQRNKDAKRNSGIEDDILLGMRMVSKEYSDGEHKLLQEQGGSDIYMPVGSSKIRALIGWIKDILLNPKEWPFDIQPTVVPELPDEIVKKITDTIKQQYDVVYPKDTEDIGSDLRSEYELRRDLQDLIIEQTKEEAMYAFKLHEMKIKDQLQEGNWHEAFGGFIDDFAQYPTAFMKGPIIHRKKRLVWENGKPVEKYDDVFQRVGVHPLDMYPSPSSTTLQKGEVVEIVRYRPDDLASMRGAKGGWSKEGINYVLENKLALGTFTLTEIEHEKAELEKKGFEHEANKDVHIGMHYHGALQAGLLMDWGCTDIPTKNRLDYVECEVMVFGGTVVKASVNKDPLHRRPYYHASFQNRPGSIWGMSLPKLLEHIQKMCNACARSLVNNMAMSSRPITGINVDRLADDGDIQELFGGDIIQFTSDPYGAGSSSPIEFFNAPSNAAELLAIYDAFENKADDASMIPKYAYGGQNVQGAAATAAGLAMLMESASKGIKEAIRHIDDGVIRPNVEYQFYWNMKKEPIKDFNGDIKVVTRGSDSLAIKGAQELRRNEFLQITSNPMDQNIMGLDGRAQILRKISEDLGLGENIVPSRLELRKKQKKEEELAQKQAEGPDKALQATKMQVEGQVAMHQSAKEIDMAKLEFDQKKHDDEMKVKAAQLQVSQQGTQQRTLAAIENSKIKASADQKMNEQRVAADLVKNDTGE